MAPLTFKASLPRMAQAMVAIGHTRALDVSTRRSAVEFLNTLCESAPSE